MGQTNEEFVNENMNDLRQANMYYKQGKYRKLWS